MFEELNNLFRREISIETFDCPRAERELNFAIEATQIRFAGDEFYDSLMCTDKSTIPLCLLRNKFSFDFCPHSQIQARI